MDPTTAIALQTGFTAIVGAVTSIILLLINNKQSRALVNSEATKIAAETAADKVETVRTVLQTNSESQGKQLDSIHTLVNSRLSEALSHIKELESLLARVQMSPDDPAVRKSVVAEGIPVLPIASSAEAKLDRMIELLEARK
jgi:hypothetical protein